MRRQFMNGMSSWGVLTALAIGFLILFFVEGWRNWHNANQEVAIPPSVVVASSCDEVAKSQLRVGIPYKIRGYGFCDPNKLPLKEGEKRKDLPGQDTVKIQALRGSEDNPEFEVVSTSLYYDFTTIQCFLITEDFAIEAVPCS